MKEEFSSLIDKVVAKQIGELENRGEGEGQKIRERVFELIRDDL